MGKTSGISFGRAFFKVFTAPRQTIREILDKDPRAYFWPLLAILTLTSDDDPSVAIFLASKMSAQAAIALSFVFNIVITLGSFWLLAWIVYVSGKAMGGKGSFRDIQAAYLWAVPPYILAAFFNFLANGSIWLALFSGETETTTLLALPRNFGQDIAMAARIILLGWSLVLQVITVAEAHQISKWKAFWAGTTQLLTIVFVILVLGTLFGAFWYLGQNYHS
ncbi:MAG TPA: Yip1 family protein [bacterium]|nr:Yip1 family protein [bacterium]